MEASIRKGRHEVERAIEHLQDDYTHTDDDGDYRYDGSVRAGDAGERSIFDDVDE